MSRCTEYIGFELVTRHLAHFLVYLPLIAVPCITIWEKKVSNCASGNVEL